MKRRTLAKLKREHAQLRRPRRPLSPRTLESLAQRLGRMKEGGGNHPLWISVRFQHLRAVPIPHHGVDIKAGTAGAILDQLEEDIFAWDQALGDEAEDDGNEDGGDDGSD
jgi:hypothetical protein